MSKWDGLKILKFSATYIQTHPYRNICIPIYYLKFIHMTNYILINLYPQNMWLKEVRITGWNPNIPQRQNSMFIIFKI